MFTYKFFVINSSHVWIRTCSLFFNINNVLMLFILKMEVTNMKKTFSIFILIILSTVLLAGCVSGPNDPDRTKMKPMKTKEEIAQEKEQKDNEKQTNNEEQSNETKQTEHEEAVFDNGVQRADGLYELPYKLVNGVKEFHLTAVETEWETKDGEVKKAWTYNGLVPGPIIKADKGDRIRVILKNELPESTVLHWHGLEVPNEMDGVPGVTQEPIEPGEKFVYEFDVNQSGTHMYHSHMKAISQVPKGLFGPIIINDPEDKEVDHDFMVVVSDGGLGYLINGKSFPATTTWNAKEGDDIRVRVINIGNQIHPMHLHGHRFTVTHKDGSLKPETVRFDEHNLEILPGSTYDIHFKARKGTWVFHCHILSHVYDGNGHKTGMIQVLVVE